MVSGGDLRVYLAMIARANEIHQLQSLTDLVKATGEDGEAFQGVLGITRILKYMIEGFKLAKHSQEGTPLCFLQSYHTTFGNVHGVLMRALMSVRLT